MTPVYPSHSNQIRRVGDKPPSIAIIGAGFSGALLAINLARQSREDLRIHLIERRPGFGRGLAYSSHSLSHLLNVMAGRISAFEDQPSHFVDWYNAQAFAASSLKPRISATDFVPRARFGAYIQQLLRDEICRPTAPHRLTLVPDDVTELIDGADKVTIKLASGRTIHVDVAVLAVGNFPPEAPVAQKSGLYNSPLFHPDPWQASATHKLDPDAPVLLIGTGLTMVDVALGLVDRGHRGRIHALSRRGLLSRPHRIETSLPPFTVADLPTHSILAMLSFIRGEIDRAAIDHIGWRAVIDGLRPASRDIWYRLPQAERRRFLRHARPWWDAHRHRTAPDVQARIDDLISAGQLVIHAGRIQHWDFGPEGAVAHFRRRRDLKMQSLDVARIINCSGPTTDFSLIRDPFIRQLLDQGQIRPDRLGLGLEVSPENAVIDRDGAISKRLFAIGPPTRGTHWESTAVPEIRKDCAALAGKIAELVHPQPNDTELQMPLSA
jgi:uncharacterized NAD(P)/FAD-binding protein YdhS